MSERPSTAFSSAELRRHLSRLFDGLSTELVHELGAGIETLALEGGQLLFAEQEPADAAYLVLSGRLRAVIVQDDGRERLLNEMGAGETIGEMAMLTDAPRSATVYAVRDTQLARISREAFDTLTEKHPAALRRIAGLVVERLRRQSTGARDVTPPIRTLAVMPANEAVALGEFCRALGAGLAELGRVESLDRTRIVAELGSPGAPDSAVDSREGARLSERLGAWENGCDHLLYQGDAVASGWNERVLRQADQVLVVARAEDEPELSAAEQRIAGFWSGARTPAIWLVLVHAGAAPPAQTSRWLAERSVSQHVHVRSGAHADFARLARLMTGRAVGLVLGGGGARGFAHLGVLRALEEVGVEIDMVGGTSIGSIIGALPAMGLAADESLDICREHISSLFDPTLPLVSLLAGRRIGGQLHEIFGEREIEDTRIPYFCVSTNLSRAEQVVHRRGPLLRAVRSSISLPGILPPVSHAGDLYVDGALLNNLPIDVMSELSRGGPVIAVDVSPERDVQTELELASDLSGWRVLWSRMNPFAARLDVPYISSVLMRSAVVASVVRERNRHAAASASLHLKLPVEGWGLLEFDSLDPIAERGYQASVEAIAKWREQLRP